MLDFLDNAIEDIDKYYAKGVIRLYLFILGIFIFICLIFIIGYSLQESYFQTRYWIKVFFIGFGILEGLRLLIFDIWYKKNAWDYINRPYQFILF